MSKLTDGLARLGHTAPARLGFGPASQRERTPVMLLVGVSPPGKTARGEVANSLDVLLVASADGSPATKTPAEGVWGAVVSRSSAEELDALKEAGCDFILIESEDAPGILLRDDGMPRGYVLQGEVSDARARALEDSPFEFLMVDAEGTSWPLTVGQALKLQDRVSSVGKHIFLHVKELPTEADLPVLRDMPVSALVFDAAKVDSEQLKTLRSAIAELPPRKHRHEHHALLPHNGGGGGGRVEPDHDDGDDEDDW